MNKKFLLTQKITIQKMNNCKIKILQKINNNKMIIYYKNLFGLYKDIMTVKICGNYFVIYKSRLKRKKRKKEIDLLNIKVNNIKCIIEKYI